MTVKTEINVDERLKEIQDVIMGLSETLQHRMDNHAKCIQQMQEILFKQGLLEK